MNFERRTYDAWLASAELPYDSLIPLLHGFKDSEQVYLSLPDPEHPKFRLIPEKYLKRLVDTSDELHLSSFQDLMQKYSILSLTIEEKDYPQCLREIPDPPGILFLQGNPDCLRNKKTAAMVGSRTASWAGIRATGKIAKELSRNGVTVISGLAFGIDAESHRGCLQGGTPTVAVMGCGLDRTYPVQHEELRKEILEKDGLIISEYAPQSKPYGYHFPYRNRLISGLADVVILMEAKIRSGSMTTVSHALKQGKEVYVYPGDPSSPMTEGNRLLLREGAHFFTEAREILEDMNWLDNLPDILQNIGCSARPVPESTSEEAVYAALKKGVLGFDEIMAVTGLSSSSLMSTLTIMQIKKMIDPLPGKRYQIST